MKIFVCIVLIVGLILVLVFFMIMSSLKSFMAPQNENDSIKQIRDFIGIDFHGNYTIIEHVSQNNHPDRPLSVSLLLSAEAFEEVYNFVIKIHTASIDTFSHDNTINYNQQTIADTERFIKEHQTSRRSPDSQYNPYFIAQLTLEYSTRILTYNETYI